jgi:membrane associated rhomboid family serine protease
MLPFGGSSNPYVLIQFGAKVNSLIVQGQVWRLVTPIFLHVGIVHLLFNTYALYVFGLQIERFFGSWRFVCIYLLSGIYGVLLSFAFSPYPAAGASGAIFGLIGTEAVFFYRYRNAFGSRGRQQFYNLLIVIGYNLVFTFSVSNIDVWGHVGGLLSGVILGWGLMPRYAVEITERGSRVLDDNRPKRWGVWVLAAFALLVLGTWLSIAIKTDPCARFPPGWDRQQTWFCRLHGQKGGPQCLEGSENR